MLNVHDLCKRFSGQSVLRGVSLHVKPGEVYGFVGPNGAGKTSLLKCVAGVVRPDQGAVTLNGVSVQSEPLKARHQLGYAPSETALYDSMTGKDMLKWMLAFHRHADFEHGLSLLDSFGLPLHKRVRTYSHGMKRKLLLTQALATHAPLLILDEPMEGLDPQARRTVEALLNEAASKGQSVLFSSHDLVSVQRSCQRVAFLRDGQLLEEGSVEALIGRVEGAGFALGGLEEVFDTLYGEAATSSMEGRSS